MSDLLRLDACELVKAYGTHKISPVEVARAVVDAAQVTQTTLNAFVTIDGDAALQSAKRSEERWRHGTPLSPLDGVPVSIKDNIYAAGMPTYFGSLAIPTAQQNLPDSPSVARLREAGATIFGKTTLPDYAHKSLTDSPRTGITRNPWSLLHSPGGSSGGAVAAVAAGIGPLALGTDGGGSIRVPASWTATFGFKPSFGRVPHHPRGAFAPLSHVGPITRTVRDAARAMTILSRPDSRDWYALPWVEQNYETDLSGELKGLRVAFSPTLGLTTVDIDAQIASAVLRATATFEELGCIVESSDPPLIDECSAVAIGHWVSFCALLKQRLGSSAELLDQSLRAMAERGAALTAQEVTGFVVRRGELGGTMNEFFDRFDLLIAPVIYCNPPVLADLGSARPLVPQTTNWCNLTGLPSASIPCGFTSDGLPIGLQLVGRRYDDSGVLRASHAFEQASNCLKGRTFPWSTEIRVPQS